MANPKVAFYWCASCGGCEEAVVDLNETVLKVTEAVDIVLWPVALDFKYKDVEAMADGEITVAFINGAIRLDEQQEIAALLRRKSQLVVAFGACAHMGGIPALANFKDRESILSRVYSEVPTVVNPDRIVPQTESVCGRHKLELPGFWDKVCRLDEVIPVDYYLPGCPPMPDTIVNAVMAILEGKLPARGTVLSPNRNMCKECSRLPKKPEKITLSRFVRPYEAVVPDDECFLAHGVVCMGPATRSGCGERCLKGNMPCRGCYGPCDETPDQGAAMLSALSTLIDGTDASATERIAGSFDDIAGTVYRFSASGSLAYKGALLPKGGTK